MCLVNHTILSLIKICLEISKILSPMLYLVDQTMLFLLGRPYNVIFYILYLLGDSKISIVYNCSVDHCESAFFVTLRPKDPGPEWKGRIWWTGPWLTAANELFKNQVKAENTPDNIKKNDKQGYRRVPKINNVSSEGKKAGLTKW